MSASRAGKKGWRLQPAHCAVVTVDADGEVGGFADFSSPLSGLHHDITLRRRREELREKVRHSRNLSRVYGLGSRV